MCDNLNLRLSHLRAKFFLQSNIGIRINTPVWDRSRNLLFRSPQS